MGWLAVLGVSMGLAMDALAVAIAASVVLPQVTGRHVFRLAFHFGLFQFLMPILGWMAGRTIAAHISRYDHWVAFGVLALLGGKMLWEAWHEHEAEAQGDPTRGWTLVGLSVATSIDALAVGLSWALFGVPIWAASILIGLVAGTLTMVGITFGARIGSRFGRWAEITGGVVLLAIGVNVLVSHLAPREPERGPIAPPAAAQSRLETTHADHQGRGVSRELEPGAQRVGAHLG